VLRCWVWHSGEEYAEPSVGDSILLPITEPARQKGQGARGQKEQPATCTCKS
jgi:hypothetical protein